VPSALLGHLSRRQFRNQLLRWFDREKRSLPWRGESDPYRILVSEIMLQQTRVAVVKDRYTEFLRQFPSVSHLARAREGSVLAAWSGLGYYRRARALHAAARQIHKNGGFPRSAEQLAELPGIGRYTAAAVASIAFAEPVAVVDGNVKRVLARLAGKELSTDAWWQTAQQLLDERRPGDFNQAMMELGATICLPGQPLCQKCPVVKLCASKGVTAKPKLATARNKATLQYLLARRNGSVLLRQRPASASLMPGMWELPALPTARIYADPILELRHSITTTDYSILIFKGAGRAKESRWFPLRSLNRLPLTGLARKVLSRLELL